MVGISGQELTDAQRNTRIRRGVSSRKKRGLETCIVKAGTGLSLLASGENLDGLRGVARENEDVDNSLFEPESEGR